MWECSGYGPITNSAAVKDRGAGWSRVPTTTERRDVFRGKDCGVVHTQYNSTARLWRGLPGDTRAKHPRIDRALPPKHSKINTWQAAGHAHESERVVLEPRCDRDLRQSFPPSPRTMRRVSILEPDKEGDVDPRPGRFVSKVKPVPGSKAAPKTGTFTYAKIPDPVETARAYRGVGRKESTHCVDPTAIRIPRDEVDAEVERWLRAHSRAGYVRPFHAVRARSRAPVDWSDLEDLVFVLQTLPEQPEDQTSAYDDRLVARMLAGLNMM